LSSCTGVHIQARLTTQRGAGAAVRSVPRWFKIVDQISQSLVLFIEGYFTTQARLLQHNPALAPLYERLSVPEWSAAQLLAHLLLPAFEALAPGTQQSLLAYVERRWAALRGDDMLKEALAATPFVDTGAHLISQCMPGFTRCRQIPLAMASQLQLTWSACNYGRVAQQPSQTVSDFCTRKCKHRSYQALCASAKDTQNPIHVCCVCAGVEGALAQPDELFDPRTQLLALVFAGQPVFPAGRFATGAWLQVGSVMAMLSWALLQVLCQHSAICLSSVNLLGFARYNAVCPAL